jgi:IclR family transcriptional regulator, acetate operon repressor
MLSDRGSSALKKALAVLEAIVDHPQAVGLPDLAARLNLARQTVHRILVKLEDARLVLRDTTRERYSIGPRLSALALTTLSSNNRNSLIKVLLQNLVDDVKETCSIGALDGVDYIQLARIEAKWPLRTHLEAGSRMASHAVSGGKLMLAELDPERLRRLLGTRKLPAMTARTITRLADLESEFAKIRARGFALSNEECFDGIIGVAVPIKDASGRTLAALAMHGPVTRLTLKMCEARVGHLLRAAQRISRAWLRN